ncbi:MAG: ABC transporter ATP-binding protein [Elusimicrobia bacterium]|nr:ABC transporter ATP-binding protein [Elusimicrobiota bacterium]
MSEIVVFEDVWKIYSPATPLEVQALKGINLKIEKGDFVAILGPSGSGKTTLLNLAGLLDFPTKGKVFIEGKDFLKAKDAEISFVRNKTVGFVFQQPSFLPEFTAIENVMIPAIIGGVSSRVAEKKAIELFKKFNLLDRKNHFPSHLSGGELQRLTVLRAIINDPKIILCDEPTGQLDEENAKTVFEVLAKINEIFGTSILLVTHNRQLTKYVKKVINLKNGFMEVKWD